MPDKPAKPATTKARTNAAGQALADRMAGLASQPAPTPARQRPAGQRKTPAARQGAAMPAEQPKPPARYDARISLTTTPEMKRDLDMARVQDGVEATARIRAMISLWQEDPRLRARIDKLAKSLR